LRKIIFSYLCSLSLAVLLFSSFVNIQRQPYIFVFAVTGSNWGQFHGDSAHNGYSSSNGPVHPEEIWTYSGIGGAENGIIAANGILIVSCPSSGNLLALSEVNGSVLTYFQSGADDWYTYGKWKSKYPASGGGLIFSAFRWSDRSGVEFGNELIIDGNYLSKGNNVWSVKIPGQPINSPYYGQCLISYYNGYVYGITFNSGNITAIQSSSGTTVWQMNLDGKIDTIPTIGNGILVIGYSNQNQITAISTATNTTLWNFITNGVVAASPAYDNGRFFFGTLGGSFYCVSENGQLVWKNPIGSAIETTPAIAYGMVFFGADDGTLYALNSTNGNLVWQHNAGSELISPPAAASNGILYQATTSGVLYAFNATNGAELWTFPIGAGVTASPVLDNGYLFLVDSNGVVHAIADTNPAVSPAPSPLSSLSPPPSPSSASSFQSSNNPSSSPSLSFNPTVSPESASTSPNKSNSDTPYEFNMLYLTVIGTVATVVGAIAGVAALKRRKIEG
jgi:outer membrane protein assembly factor BamB